MQSKFESARELFMRDWLVARAPIFTICGVFSFPLRGCRRALLVGSVLLVTATRCLGAQPTGEAWQEILNSAPKRVLKTAAGANVSREEKLAEGAAWMSLQPSTDENLAKAAGIFAELAQGDDEIAAQAAYLRARLWQLHFLQPNYARAAELFEQLAARQPESHWAQLGLVKLGMLKLYVLPDVPDRIAAAEEILTRITEPELQRDLHLQIGQAGVLLKEPLERFLPHLVAADQIGGISGTAREDLIVQIGELSMRAGLPEQAQKYLELYLKEFPNNVRAYAVAERLAEARQLLAGKETAQ